MAQEYAKGVAPEGLREQARRAAAQAVDNSKSVDTGTPESQAWVAKAIRVHFTPSI